MKVNNHKFGISINLIISILGIIGIFFIAKNLLPSNIHKSFFMTEWVATQKLIYKGKSPYSKSTQNDIEAEIYNGRVARPSEDNYFFTSPIFSLIILIPFALIKSSTTAKITYFIFIFLLISLFIYTNLIVSDLSKNKFYWVPFILFTYLSIPLILSIGTNGFTIISSLCILYGIFSLKYNYDARAGLFFAFSSISPAISWAVILYTLVWTLSNRRRNFVLGLGAGMFAQLIIGILFSPSWIIDYFQSIVKFSKEVIFVNLTNLFNPPIYIGIFSFGVIILIMIVSLMIYEWVAGINQSVYGFLWTLGITISYSSLITYNIKIINQILLLLPMALIFSAINQKFGEKGFKFSTLLMFILILVGWILSSTNLIENPLSALYFPFINIIGLYWIRHWNRNIYEKYSVPNQYLKILKKL